MMVFRAINQLKRQLGDTKNLQLCNICVENRKVACGPAAFPPPMHVLLAEACRLPAVEVLLQLF